MKERRRKETKSCLRWGSEAVTLSGPLLNSTVCTQLQKWQHRKLKITVNVQVTLEDITFSPRWRRLVILFDKYRPYLAVNKVSFITTLKIWHYVTQCTHITKAFFTFTLSHSCTVRIYMYCQWRQKQKYGLPWADFHETYQCSTALRTDHLYTISPKSGKKMWKVQTQIYLRP